MMDKFLMWLAYRMPRRLVYWCMIRAGAWASTGDWGHQVVPDMTFMDALKRWELGENATEEVGDSV